MALVFYEVKHIFFDCLNESEVYRSQTKSKSGLKKKISGGAGLLIVFKTPRENWKDQDKDWSRKQLQRLKVISTHQPTQQSLLLYVNKESHEILFNFKGTDKQQISQLTQK